MQCHGVKAEYATVDSHMCEEAHQHGMSLGKYYAIQELLTADPQATLDEFKDKTMKEIKGHTEHCEHRQQRMQGEMWGESPEGSFILYSTSGSRFITMGSDSLVCL